MGNHRTQNYLSRITWDRGVVEVAVWMSLNTGLPFGVGLLCCADAETIGADRMQVTGNEIQTERDTGLNGNETVLVVDDFELVRNLLNDALTAFGYSVICAEDGIDGLKKYTDNKDKIHVLLLDVVMPRLNGIELFREINKSESNIKVLFMSGYNEIISGEYLKDKMKFITKPFNIKMLLKEMRYILDN